MLERINRVRLFLLFNVKLIALIFILTQCSSAQDKTGDFETYLNKFKPHGLPFEISEYGTLHVYSDTVIVEVPNGIKYEKNIYSSILKDEFKYLPTEPKLKPGFAVTYQAIYQFETKQDFKMVLVFKELDADNEHEDGLGVNLILVTYGKDGNQIDSLPLAYSIYNIKEQVGAIDANLKMKTKSEEYLYDQMKTRILDQEFETTSNGKFKLNKSDTTMQELH